MSVSPEIQRKIDELINAVESHQKGMAGFNWQTFLADIIAAVLKALQGTTPLA